MFIPSLKKISGDLINYPHPPIATLLSSVWSSTLTDNNCPYYMYCEVGCIKPLSVSNTQFVLDKVAAKTLFINSI